MVRLQCKVTRIRSCFIEKQIVVELDEDLVMYSPSSICHHCVIKNT